MSPFKIFYVIENVDELDKFIKYIFRIPRGIEVFTDLIYTTPSNLSIKRFVFATFKRYWEYHNFGQLFKKNNILYMAYWTLPLEIPYIKAKEYACIDIKYIQ